MAVAGRAWVWVLPVALAGQCLLMSVYAELAGKFPLANGAYQWSRRLIGPRYGWFTGWVGLCAFAVANTTIAYLGAPWALIAARDHAHADGDRHHRRDPRARLLDHQRVRRGCAQGRAAASASRPRRSRRSASASRCCWSSASRASAC